MRRQFAWVSLFLLIASAAVAKAPETGIRIPVELFNNRIHIPISVAGKEPTTFILDTGAGRSPIDADYAKRVGITAEKRGMATGAAGSVDIDVSGNVLLEVGPIDITVHNAALVPFGAISLRAGKRIDGVLGYDIFKNYVAEIDYAGKQVTFYEPKPYRPPADAVMIPFELRHGTPHIDVKVTLADGRTVNANVLVDTGAGNALTLNKKFTEKHAIDLSQALQTSLMLGVGGSGGAERVARVKAVEFGGFKFEQPVAIFSQATAGALAEENTNGILGAQLLRRFTLTVDYTRKRLYLVPNGALNDPLEYEMAGAILTVRDAAFDAVSIHAVLPSSPAAEAGVQVGDEVRAINGERMTPAKMDDIRKLFREPDRKITMTLVRNGAEREVTFTTRRIL